MKLDRARRTSRPSVVWLDDKMSLMLEQVGHLNSRGFDVTPTASITDFLRALQNQVINIAIIDIKLGEGEDGRALIDLVYESRPEIGIIVHSNFPNEFLAARYDAERVRFVSKNSEHEPIEVNDPWPLADAAVDIIDSLNKRRAGLAQYPVSLSARKDGRRRLTWSTVQSIREFAIEHAVLPIVVLVLLMKAALLSDAVDFSPDTILTFFYQVAGFVLPFLVALLLAWCFTPREIREARSPDKLVHIYLEKLSADPDLRLNVNRQIAESGAPTPQDDISALRLFFEVIDTQRLWLARLVLGVFAVGALYLLYDIGVDVLHLIHAIND